MKNNLARRAFCLTALGLSLAPLAAQAQALDPVRVGINNVVSDVVFRIAEKKGFFAKHKLKVELLAFDSGPKMVAPLGAGQIDVGAGASSAGLYNAVGRGINIRIVADKGSTPKGYDYMPLLVRKSLVDSGQVKTLADMKGMKFGEVGPGAATNSKLAYLLEKVGLTYKDVQHNYITYPQQLASFASGAIDGAITTEPSATQAVASGTAVRFVLDGYVDHTVAVVLYNGEFIAKRRDVAQRFMNAYVEAARVYNDATAGGTFSGPGAAEVIELIKSGTGLKDEALIRTMIPNGVHPDGKVNLKTLNEDLKFFADNKYLERPAKVEDVVDTSFVEAAAKALGPYKPAK